RPQLVLPGRRRPAHGAARPWRGLAGHRHPERPAAGGRLHRDDRTAPRPAGRQPGGNRLGERLDQRRPAAAAGGTAARQWLRRVPRQLGRTRPRRLSAMRILLTGANGQLGTELRRSLAPLGQLLSATRTGTLPDGDRCERVDLGRPATLSAIIARLRPDVVVNAAAYTAVDRAETEPELAYRINAEAVDALALACADTGARLIHYSTDYVFSGENDRPWRED